MSDENATPTAPTAAEIEVLQSSYARMKVERDTAATEAATAKRERDAALAEKTTLVTERDELRARFGQTETALTELTNKTRERDVLEGLRAAFPGVEPATLRGAFLGQVEEKKTERYPAEPAKVLPGLIELLKTSNPLFTRAAPVDGGGPPPKVETPAKSSRAGKNVFTIGAPEQPTP